MVVVSRKIDGTPDVWCDPEILDLVRALNAGGIRTVASCSGHGFRPGNIALEDGRELIIASSFEEAREVEAAFPLDINGQRSQAALFTEEDVHAALAMAIEAAGSKKALAEAAGVSKSFITSVSMRRFPITGALLAFLGFEAHTVYRSARTALNPSRKETGI